MQGLSLPENTLVIWAHPAFSRDAVKFMGQHQLVKELQSPCSEAGERAVGLVLDAVAGRRSWESLFLGVEATQKLAWAPVNATGDLQCPACQGTSSARQCGNRLSSSPACWRLPDEKGQYKWLSTTSLIQLKASEAWLQPASRMQCLRKLLMRAHHNTMLSGAMQPSEVSTSFNSSEQELSCMTGAVICLGPGMQEMLNRLKLIFEMQWYTDIMVVQGSNVANTGCGEKQAKAQAAKLPQYELHVLVAQPHSQDKAPKSPVQQPRMVLDGAELDSATVNSLLEMASSKNDQPSNLGSRPSCTADAPTQSSSGRTEPKVQSTACTTAGRAAAVVEKVCGLSEPGFRQLLGATAQPCSAPEARSSPKHSQSLAPPMQGQQALTKGAIETLLQPLRRTKPSMGPISSMLSGSREAPVADASKAASRTQLSAHMASLVQAVITQQHQGSGASPGLGRTPGQPQSGAKQDTLRTDGSACSGKHDAAAESSQKQPRPSVEDMRMSLLQKISGVPRGLSGSLGARVGAAHMLAVSQTIGTQPLGNNQPAVSRSSAAPRMLMLNKPASVLQSAAVDTFPREEAARPQCSGGVRRMAFFDGKGPAFGGRDLLEQAMRLPPGIHRQKYPITHQLMVSLSRARTSESAAAGVVEAAGGGGSRHDRGSWQDVQSNAAPAELLPLRLHRKPASLPAASATASAEVQIHRKPENSFAAPVGHLAQSDSGRLPAASAFAPEETMTNREPGIVPAVERIEQEPFSLPTASSNAHQAYEQPRRHAGHVEVEMRARSSDRGMAAKLVDMRNACEAAALVNSTLQQHSSGRPCQSASVAPARRISHVEMESSIVGDSCRQEPLTPAVEPRNRGGRPCGRGSGSGRAGPRPVDPPAPRAQPDRESTAAEENAIPFFFTARRLRSKRNVVRGQGLLTAWIPPEGGPSVLAAGPVQLPQPQPHAPSTIPDPSAPGTPLSRAVATVPCVSPRQMALFRAALQDSLGSAEPLGAKVIPTACEISAGVAYGSLAAASDAVADAAAIIDPSGEGAAAGELAAANGRCSVEISSIGQQGSAGCTAEPNGTAPEVSGVNVPMEDMEAAKEMPQKKRRKEIVQETLSASLSPPGAFGRAVFGRKKRGSNDVATYNEKKLRQQRWKAEQKELQEKRQRRRANEAEHMTQADGAAYACGDRSQLLMCLLPDHGINNGHAGFRMSVFCSAVLADAGNFMSVNLDSCEKRLVAGLDQSCSRTLSKADETALRAHKDELDCLAAYLNSPNDRPLQKQGARRERKPGRPRKTLRLASTPEAADTSEADRSSAPEPSSAQIPGTQPAALQPPTAVARRRGAKPGRRPKKPAAKFADPTALSALSGNDAVSAGVSGDAAAPSAAAAASSAATSAAGLSASARGASGCVTSALNTVTELCRDVNPPAYASSDGTTPAHTVFAGRSRLHVSSGVPPLPGALQQAHLPAAEQGSREDPANAEIAEDVTSTGAPVTRVNEVAPTALSAGPDIAVESVPTETANEAGDQQDGTPSGPHKPPPASPGPAEQPSDHKFEVRTAGNGIGDTVAEAVVLVYPGAPALQQGAPAGAGAQLPAAEGQPVKRKRGRPPGGKNKRARTAGQPETEGNRPRADPVPASSTAGPEPAVAATARVPAAESERREGTDHKPAKVPVAPGSATGASPAAVQRKRGRPPGSKNKGATGALVAAKAVVGQSGAAENAKDSEQPRSPEQAKTPKQKKGASAAEPELPRSVEQAKKTGKARGSARAVEPKASAEKMRTPPQQKQKGCAGDGNATGVQPKISGAVALSHMNAPAAPAQQTPTSAGMAEVRTGPARTAADDWRLMKVRGMATWEDIYSRLP